jgi:hypothetical protein
MRSTLVREIKNISCCVGTGAALLAMACGCGSGVLESGGGNAIRPAAVPQSPKLGYVWNDTEGSLRPILGVVGSSQIGQTVVPAGLYKRGASSAVSGVALLEESGGTLDLMRLPDGEAVVVGTGFGSGLQIRFASSGSVAIAFVPGASGVKLITGMPSSSQMRSIALTAAVLDGAVSDDGSVAVAMQVVGGVNIAVIAGDGKVVPAAKAKSVGGLGFAGSSDDLVFADSTANTLTVVHSASTAPSAVQVQTGNLLKQPIAVGTSRDGRWVVIANSGDASVIVADLAAQTAPQRIACSCKPTMAAQLAGTGAFRVTDIGSGPAWMLDATASAPKMLFIPAIRIAGVAAAGEANAGSAVRP